MLIKWDYEWGKKSGSLHWRAECSWETYCIQIIPGTVLIGINPEDKHCFVQFLTSQNIVAGVFFPFVSFLILFFFLLWSSKSLSPSPFWGKLCTLETWKGTIRFDACLYKTIHLIAEGDTSVKVAWFIKHRVSFGVFEALSNEWLQCTKWDQR